MHWGHIFFKFGIFSIFILVVFFVYHGSLKIMHLDPIHFIDGLTSLFELGEHVRVIEGQRHDCNFDLVFLLFVAEVRQTF